MTKNSKLVLALLLAAMMLLSVVAFADAPTTGTITITNSNDGTVTASERTFKAYRVLNATEVFGNGDNKPATGYAYTFPNAYIQSQIASYLNLTQNSGESDIAFAQRIITEMGTKSAAADIEPMAKKLLEIAKNASSGLTAVELTGGTPSAQIPFGYYVIEDTTNPEKPNVSAVMLDTNNPDVEIKVKASKPTLDKKIDEGTTGGRYDDNDKVYDNHRIGDKVPYVMKSNIPDMTGFTKYYYIVNDTMSKGLAYNNDLVIKAYTASGVARTLEKDEDYTVTPAAATDGKTATDIKIVFKDFYTKEKDHAGETLEFTYSATLTEDAIIGVEGNPNTANLIYSNNPNDDYSSEPTGDEPQNEDLVSETVDSTVRTYVTGLKLLKVDPTDAHNPLSGATFELSGNLNKVEVLKAEKFVQDNENGTYYALNDGTYTTTAPTSLNSEAEDYDDLIAKYKDQTGATKYSKTTVEEKTAAGNPKKVSETTDAAGTLIFDGMGDGKFTLTETQAPTGYNLLKTPIEFEVEWAAPTGVTDGSGNCTWKVKDNSVTDGYEVTFDNAKGEFQITVENKTGAELPSTGGIGTTIFYVAGSIMVLAAAILLITKRRMGAND